MPSPAHPTFVGVGSKKCASTWLSECLREHPEIFMTNPKETHYLSEGDSLEGYLEFFEGAEHYKARGEFTPNYLPNAEVIAPRIKQVVGPVKILAILRDPVKRYVSHYKWFLGRLKELDAKSFVDLDEATFARANATNDNMLICGNYSADLKVFMDLFGAENVYPLIYEEVFADPATEVRKLFTFLEVDDEIVPPVVNRRVRQGYVPKYESVEYAKRAAFRFAKRYAPWTINYIRKMRLEDVIRSFNRRKSPFKVSPGVIDELGSYYEAEIDRMRELLGKELPLWGHRD